MHPFDASRYAASRVPTRNTDPPAEFPSGDAAANRYAAAVCGQRGAVHEDAAFFRGWRAALL
jgi:hypothetical protein